MEKYENYDNNESLSRIKRNEHIYNSNDIGELSRIKTNNNISIISDGKKTINIEKIKSYIENSNGSSEIERKKISFDLPSEEEPKNIIDYEEKNYDINEVLEKAREKQEIDYEENRHRKINNTQIDILKRIKIKEVKNNDLTPSMDELNTEEKTIVDLIQNISNNKSKNTNDEDLFNSLMGDDGSTVVLGVTGEEDMKEALLNMTRDLENIKEPDNDFTKQLNLELEKLKDEETKEVEEKEDTEEIKLDNSFYTTSVSFNKSDFEGFDDLQETARKSSLFTKISIVFVILLLLGTLFIIANYVFDLGLI